MDFEFRLAKSYNYSLFVTIKMNRIQESSSHKILIKSAKMNRFFVANMLLQMEQEESRKGSTQLFVVQDKKFQLLKLNATFSKSTQML